MISGTYQRVKHLYYKINPFYRFFLNGFILFVLWYIFYNFFRYIGFIHMFYEFIIFHLTSSLLYASEGVLNLFGYKCEVIPSDLVIRITGSGGIKLERGCLGRNLMFLYAGFVVAFPGSVKTKLWYVPLGLAIIYVLNIARISGLSISLYHSYENYFRYHNHEVFNYSVYAMIFVMWVIWIKKFGIK